jgi:hypothetical protein
MVNPLATKTLQDVVTYVKTQFGDADEVQVTTDMIRMWTNQAQVELVSKTTIIQATASTAISANTNTVPVPVDTVQIETVVWNGTALKPIDFQGSIDQTAQFGASGEPTSWTTWGNSLFILPAPTVAGTVWLYYIAQPENVSALSDLLGVPDRYFDKILMFVMSKAYELDQDWTGHTAQRQQFEAEVASLQNAERNAQGSNIAIRDVDDYFSSDEVW